MALFLEFTYGKKLGLPAYSSHSFSITLRSEVSDLQGVAGEAEKIYRLLQESVDAQIVHAGHNPVPISAGSSPEPRNGHGTDLPHTNGQTSPSDREWKCSPKQRDLILRVIEENKLDKRDIEKLSQQLFNTPVLALNRLQASGLIENLLQTYGDSKPSGGNGRRQYQRGGAR